MIFSRRATVAVLIATIALTACVPPPAKRPPDLGVPTPEKFSAPTSVAGEPETEWWTTFGDPDLPLLIEIAIEENRDLMAAEARLSSAEAEARIAGADLKPTVGLGATGSAQRYNPASQGLDIPGIGGPRTFTQVGVSLDVSWEIDLWGRIRAGVRAAVAELQASEADLRGARQSIAAQTAKAWFAVVEAREQVELSRNSVESFRRTVEQIRRRFEQGVRPALDLRLAISNLAVAEALLDRREIELDSATRQLEVLLGRYPGRELDRLFPSEKLVAMPPPVPVGLPAELVGRRPDLVAAERRLTASEQLGLKARRELYPKLSLTGSGGALSSKLGDLVDGDFGVWNLVANLTQPLFQGGRLRAGIDRADAQVEEVLALFGGTALRAFSEVESTLAAEGHLLRRREHLAEADRQLSAAQRLAEERYRLGVGGYLVVLESQTRALTAASELLVVRRQLLSNRVDLHLALGGGFETPEEQPQPDDEDSGHDTANEQIAEETERS